MMTTSGSRSFVWIRNRTIVATTAFFIAEAVAAGSTLAQGYPNCPSPTASWGLDRIDQRDLPGDCEYAPPNPAASGLGVNIYVVSTGIDVANVEFGGRAVWLFDAVGGPAGDCNGAGTLMASLAGGTTWGAAKHPMLYSVRVTCSGAINPSDFVAGLQAVKEHAEEMPGSQNVALLPAYDCNPAFDDAIQSLLDAGVTVVVPAGNSDQCICEAGCTPVSIPPAIVVGSTDMFDTLATFSNYGPCVDIFAPGVSVTGAGAGGGTATASGSAFAASYVAGVVANYMSSASAFLTPTQVHDLLRSRSTPIENGTMRLLYSGLDNHPVPPPPSGGTCGPCVEAEADNVLCVVNPIVGPTGDYDVTLTVRNNSGTEARFIELPDDITEPDFLVLPTPLPGGGASTSVWLTLTGATPLTDVCFSLVLLDANGDPCCPSDPIQPVCVTVPECEDSVPSWGLDRLDQRHPSLDGQYLYPPPGGEGVNLYVLSTGINATHPDFGGRAVALFDALGGNGADCNGLGTMMATLAGGTRFGAAKAPTVYSVRVADCLGNVELGHLAEGIDFVAWHAGETNPNGRNVALLPVRSCDPMFNTVVIQNLIDAGVAVVVPAGNEGEDFCRPECTSLAVPDAIVVGATRQDDCRAGFSNYGPWVDVFAPGEDVTGGWHTGMGVMTLSGTELAASYVAGIVANYLSLPSPPLTPGQVHDLLRARSTPVSGCGEMPMMRLAYAGLDEDPLPPVPLLPDCTGPAFVMTAAIVGAPTGADWQWQIVAPNGDFVDTCVVSTDGVTPGNAADDLAAPFGTWDESDLCERFADSINEYFAARHYVGAPAQCITLPGEALLSVHLPCDFELFVNGCQLGVGQPCVFNPTIERLPLPGVDCNDNGFDDVIDIESGTSTDVNGNMVPDECEDLFCSADITGPAGTPDGNVDALDFLLLIGQWGSPCSGACAADVTGPAGTPDGNVDALDFLLLIGQWGNPGNCS